MSLEELKEAFPPLGRIQGNRTDFGPATQLLQRVAALDPNLRLRILCDLRLDDQIEELELLCLEGESEPFWMLSFENQPPYTSTLSEVYDALAELRQRGFVLLPDTVKAKTLKTGVKKKPLTALSRLALQELLGDESLQQDALSLGIEELRGLFSQRPSRKLFMQILDQIRSAWSDDDKAALLEYAALHLESWPDASRAVHAKELSLLWPDFPGAEAPAWFALVTSLQLRKRRASLKKIRCLAASEHLSGLRMLHMGDSWIEDEIFVLLAESPYFSQLHTLKLRACSLSAQGVASLAHFEHLEILDLGYNNLGNDGLAALAEVPSLEGLRELDLYYTGCTDEGAYALATSAQLKGLQKLDLRANKISEAGAQSLQDAFEECELLI